MIKRVLIIGSAIIACVVMWWLISPLWRTVVRNEPPPQPAQKTAETAASAVVAQAAMVASAHDVKGRALLLETDGQKIVRFEDLETINGPDLRIYLSAGLDANDFVDLGPIRATRDNVNYPVPPDTDTSKYRHVLIWCRAFGVLFSYAAL